MAARSTARRKVLRSYVLVFVTAVTIGTPRAFAAPGNTYAVDIDSSPDAPGPAAGTVGNYVGRLDNLGPGTLGSANIGAPQGFTIQSVSAPLLDGVNQQGTATLNASGVIELRSLNAPSGHFVTISFTALGPCASGGYSWPDPAVKKGPGFTGPSFSKSTTAPSDQSTDISGNCHLAFLTQPAATELSNVTTSVGFDPNGPPVRVEAQDGANDPLTSFTGTVELGIDSTTLPPGSPAPDISGNSASVPSPSPGVYSFPNLTLSPDTQYTLRAMSSAIPSMGWQVSGPFRVWENACEQGNRCDAGDRRSVTASVESGAALTSTTGDVETSQATSLVLVSVGADPLPDCGDSFNHPPAAITVDTTGSIAGTKTLTVTIDRSIVNALSNNGAKFYEACFARPQAEGTFTTTDGTDAPLVGDEYIGLLPDCPSNPTDPDAPCVLSKSKTMGGDVTLMILLDAADPRCC